MFRVIELRESRQQPLRFSVTERGEGGIVILREVGEDDEATRALGLELLLHLDKDCYEVRLDNCEVRPALVHREGGEPPQHGGPDVRIRTRVRVARGDLRVVERDVGGEGVEELLLRIHRNIRRREFSGAGRSEEVIMNNNKQEKERKMGKRKLRCMY